MHGRLWLHEGRKGALPAEGRRIAFERARIDRTTEPIPAIARYSGQPYATPPGVLEAILSAMSRGLQVVIVSGVTSMAGPRNLEESDVPALQGLAAAIDDA